MLAQCFWPRLGVKVACVSGLVVLHLYVEWGLCGCLEHGFMVHLLWEGFELLDSSGTESRVGS